MKEKVAKVIKGKRLSEDNGYRVFISYRGESTGNREGIEFAERLYKRLTGEPFEYYGKIYYSPETERLGNFDMDIPRVMRTVKFFIVPLTKEYFYDFWIDEGRVNPDSITYKEITAAIKANASFICVRFPDFDMKEWKTIIEKCFAKNSRILTAAKTLELVPNKDNKDKVDIIEKDMDRVITDICNELMVKDLGDRRIGNLISKVVPNLRVMFKSETEGKEAFPFFNRLHDVKKVTLLNFASSSFIAGIDIAEIYKETDTLKRWFEKRLVDGDITVDIIITDPLSFAAKEAAEFKMFPQHLKTNRDDIIISNFNKLVRFKSANPKAKLNIYLTNLSLPYGVMITEHKNRADDHMKVDMYAPVIDHDGKRPSFFMLKNNKNTKEMYTFFEDNIIRIKDNYAYSFEGPQKADWISSNVKPIIHRGVLNKSCTAHRMASIEACVKEQLPVEVDLLFLKDGGIVLGRKEEIINGKNLSEYTIAEITKLNMSLGGDSILRMDEFFDLIDGKIPALIEIKTEVKGPDKQQDDSIRRSVKTIWDYQKKHLMLPGETRFEHCKVAIHSSDPHVINLVREYNATIPCGIITTDFRKYKDLVKKDPDFVEAHLEEAYMNRDAKVNAKNTDSKDTESEDTKPTYYVAPDFISCDVNYLDSGVVARAKDKGIPVLAWTVKNIDEQKRAEAYGCDNIIKEGF